MRGPPYTHKNFVEPAPGVIEGVGVGVDVGVLEMEGVAEGEAVGGAPKPLGSVAPPACVPHSAAPAPYR